MKVLILEDDAKIASYLDKGLSEAGYMVHSAQDGEAGFEMAARGEYDLIILDMMLPKLDGLSVLNKLRGRGIQTKVLVLSAKSKVDDRIAGLQAGGDDYLTKPFVFGELLARCQALLRRHAPNPEPNRLKQGSIVVDFVTREVFRLDKKIELQTKEFSLLGYFLRNANRVVSKTQILEAVWGYNFDPQTNVVDVLVCRLRNKLDRGFDEKTIQTIRGVGYVFKPA